MSAGSAALALLLTGFATVHVEDSVPDPAAMVGHTPGASEVERPNVVFVLTDDMRADDLRHMPHTTRLLADRGMTFEDAIAPHPLCCPARANLVTGQYAQNNGVRHNRGPWGGFQALDPAQESSVWFRQAGYQTGFVGKFLNGYGPGDAAPAGWSTWDALQRGVYDYHDFTFAGDGAPEAFTGAYVTDSIGERTNRLVERFADDDAPFLIYSWHLAPHYQIAGGHPTDPPAAPRDADAFGQASLPSSNTRTLNQANVSQMPAFLRRLEAKDLGPLTETHRARLRSLQAVDRSIASLVSTLDEEGVLDDTFIIFSSDNGYSLGEHRLVGKNALTQEAMRVPLVVRGPGITPGTTSSLPASLVDIPATIADLASAVPSWVIDGSSLEPTLHGGVQLFRDTTLIQTGSAQGDGWAWRGVRTDRYTYGSDGREQFLFDRALDPDGLHNVVTHPAYAQIVPALAARTALLANCAGWSCNQVFGSLPPPSGDVTEAMAGVGETGDEPASPKSMKSVK